MKPYQNYSLNENCSYLFRVNNGNTRAMCEICWKLTIKTPEQPQSRSSDAKQISHIVRGFPLLTGKDPLEGL